MTESSAAAKPAKSESKSSESKENTSVDPERQKNVTGDYRANWKNIFAKK